jgi:predicted amino acid racemase
MAYLKLYKDKLQHNFNVLENWFNENNVEWGVVSKLLCGHKPYIKVLVDLGAKELHDTRISNLKAIKKVSPEVQTVYIKPPPKRSISSVIRYADVSFNTDLDMIKKLSAEAVRQGRKHKIIIMVEMGDLREGVMGDNLVEFYREIFELPNINVIGLGTNLNCLNGIMPSQDKLIQLCLYKQLVEATFKRKVPWVSGGTSVTVPLMLKKQLPKCVNHFRVGEILFFGLDMFTGKTIKGMHDDVFKLYAEIIELREKPVVPIGEQMTNVAGETPEFNPDDMGKSSYRAILDVGLLDVNPRYLKAIDPKIKIVEASSDMLVVDLGKNPKGYKSGDIITFKPRYMAVLSLMNSDYIDKTVVEQSVDQLSMAKLSIN